MTRMSDEERLADLVVRDDDLWEGTGLVPVPDLRRMMVSQEGGALRSGVRQLALRELPDWVRARVRALTATERTGPLLQQLALRRP